MATPPGAVLFACNLNRVRSPMAEGLMRRAFGARVFVDSCGLHAKRARFAADAAPADPFVLAAMDEIGVDVTKHQPKNFDDLEDASFDVVISLTPEAHHRAVELEYWPTQDPTLASGARETVLDAYRAVRDGLEARIRARFGHARTFGG